jgi:DNA-directed RNA polymerase subunit RPC12/RpoP
VATAILGHVRIIKESVALINQSRNLDTQIHRLDAILEHATYLLRYEERGIPTACDPPPSQLTGEQVAKWRDAVIVAGMQEEVETALAKVAMSKNARARRNCLSKVLLRIQRYKARASSGAVLDGLETRVRQHIDWPQLAVEAKTAERRQEQPDQTDTSTSIRFTCDRCGQHLEADQEIVGQPVLCTNCGEEMIVPRASTLPDRATTEAADISFACNKCGQMVLVDAAGAGLGIQCPTCSSDLIVPQCNSLAPVEDATPQLGTYQLRVGEYSFSIPERIYRLLWITDQDLPAGGGPLPTINFGSQGFGLSLPCEPSLISTSWPIEEPPVAQAVEAPPYYPNYGRLTPQQRWIFLNWLTDVRQPINLGYVYTYYYGLERHLLLGEFLLAMEEIVVLRQHHRISYSYDALLAACIYRKDRDLLAQTCARVRFNAASDLALHAFSYFGKELTADHLTSMAAGVELGNQRYIKTQRDTFLRSVEAVLIARYQKPTCPILQKYNWNALPESTKCPYIVFANYSFPSDIRTPLIRQFFRDGQFKREIREILEEAHDRTKNLLKDARHRKGVVEREDMGSTRQ